MDHATLLITRPREAGRRFLAACEAAAGRPLPAILSPLMAIRTVQPSPAGRASVGDPAGEPRPEASAPTAPDPGVRDSTGLGWDGRRLDALGLDGLPAALILTSERAATRAAALGLPAGLPAWCVGPRTAAAAARRGFRPVAVAPDAAALVATMAAALRAQEDPLLHVRGEPSRGEVAAQLRAAGLDVREVVAYRQEARPPSAAARAALDAAWPLVLPLFSPRSADLVAALRPIRAPLHVVAQSAAVAEAARALGPAALEVAAAPHGAAMVAATLEALEAAGRTARGDGGG